MSCYNEIEEVCQLPEGEVKDAKSVVAVMIKGGIRPTLASYLSVKDELYKSGRVNKIAAK
ncbi:pentatricopeptide repeat-containing protein, partial [Trifolium pratense]